MPASASIWVDGDRRAPERTDLPNSAPVVVVGAGVIGLATATMLVEHGVEVVVIDARRTSDAVSVRSSAKVSALHELTAARIDRRSGIDTARAYLDANRFGADWIAGIVDEQSIDCAWERRDAITYVTDPSSRDDVERDAELYAAAGFDATTTSDLDLPFPVETAVRVGGQAQCDPARFLAGLSQRIIRGGGHIVTDTRAVGARDRSGRVTLRTDAGEITTDHLVVTTGLPFLDRGGHFARCEPQSSYVVACEIESDAPDGMFLSADGPKRSLRTARTADGTDVILVGGEGHKTGQGGDTEQHYDTLARWADRHFGVRRVTHRFMAQDYMSPDHVPFAGPVMPGSERIHIATGMSKWGFTNGVAAAAVNVAAIVGTEVPSWTSAFDSRRIPLPGLPLLVKANANVAAHMVGGWVGTLRRRAVPTPGEGSARLTRHGVTSVAVGDDGKRCTVSGICPHLGGILAWNPAEQTWDCPLHGSRFEADGRLLHGPATADLHPATD